MAFRLSVTLQELEYRGVRSDVNKDGQRWMALLFEDRETNQLNVSVPRDMHRDVNGLDLRKGDLCNVALLAVATSDGKSYLQLRALPEILEDEE